MVDSEHSNISPGQQQLPGDFDARFHQALQNRLGAARYETWFPNRVRFDWDGARLTIGVANLIVQNLIQRSFVEVVRTISVDLIGRSVEPTYVVNPALFKPSGAAKPRMDAQAKAEATGQLVRPEPDLFTAVPKASRAAKQPATTKRRWRHLNDFVVGACNRVAHAAAVGVVEEPGQGPNPLVLHGPVGTGKSHLLEGICAGLRRRRPELRVLFVTAEDFTNRFVAAMRFGKQSSFRRHFRGCDVLLLDDLHFLAKKKATQEEFLHTFDALLSDGKQVVVTCDCHPRLNDDFLPELLDRLLGGAIWGLQPPDPETRLALLRAKSGNRDQGTGIKDERTTVIPEEVLAFLAERLRGNVRELEGALHALRHFSRVTGRRIDVEVAREALGELLRHAVRVVRLTDVDRAVCTVLQLPSGTLQSKERTWAVSHPRMLAIYLSRKHTAASFGEMSKHFGGKSHSSAVAAEKKVRQWLQDNTAITAGGREWPTRELIERIERELLS